MAAAGTMTVKVVPDLSAFRHATIDEVARVLASHIYGDDGPYMGGALSVCTQAATDLCERFTILPSGKETP